MGAVVQGRPALRASTRASSADADRRTRRGLWITGRAEGASPLPAGDWRAEQEAAGHAAGALVIDQFSHVIPSSRERFAASFPGFPPPPHVTDAKPLVAGDFLYPGSVAFVTPADHTGARLEGQYVTCGV